MGLDMTIPKSEWIPSMPMNAIAFFIQRYGGYIDAIFRGECRVVVGFWHFHQAIKVHGGIHYIDTVNFQSTAHKRYYMEHIEDSFGIKSPMRIIVFLHACIGV